MTCRRPALLLLACLAGTARADDAADVQRLLSAGDAAGALQRSAQAPPQDAKLRFLHGVALMDLGRDAEATAAFNALAQDFPQLPEPHNNLALLHARAGRLEAARQALETALRNDPGNATARMNLGDIHLRLAIEAWQAAASAAAPRAALQQRLRLAREIAALPR